MSLDYNTAGNIFFAQPDRDFFRRRIYLAHETDLVGIFGKVTLVDTMEAKQRGARKLP